MRLQQILPGLLLFCAVAVVAPNSAKAQFTKEYKVEPLADGVFAILWPDIGGYPVEGNHLVIVNEHDVIVVDANRTPALADTVIAIVRSRTAKPVRYVINTHWHADHVQGNAVYQRVFPGVEIIGHPGTVAGMDTVLVPYIAEVRADVAEARKNQDERLPMLEREATLYDHVQLSPPSLLVRESIVLRRGDREIRVFHPGPANTAGDLIVHLPTEGIVAVGDLVTRPFPFIGYDSPRGWANALDGILALEPRLVVPGHGEVMRSTEYVELFRDLFTELSSEVADALDRGVPASEVNNELDLSRYWRVFADGDEAREEAFATRFQPALVERAIKEHNSNRQP